MWLDIIFLLYMIGIGMWDIKYRVVTVKALLLGVILVGIHVYQGNTDIYMILLGGGIGILFIGVSRITKEGLGYGDSMVILLLGIYLGVWQLLYGLCLAFFWCAMYGGIQLAIGHRNRTQCIPFLPFLVLGYMGGIWV